MRLTVTRYRAYGLSGGVVDVVGGGVIDLVGGGVGVVVVDVVGPGAGAAVCAYAGTPVAMPSAIARTNFTIGNLRSMSDN
jgi:hypothetical protein